MIPNGCRLVHGTLPDGTPWFRIVRPDWFVSRGRPVEFERIIGSGWTPDEATEAAWRAIAGRQLA